VDSGSGKDSGAVRCSSSGGLAGGGPKAAIDGEWLMEARRPAVHHGDGRYSGSVTQRSLWATSTVSGSLDDDEQDGAWREQAKREGNGMRRKKKLVGLLCDVHARR
jgi:hypothetical protein